MRSGRPVLLTARDVHGVPFDIRAHRHLVYDSAEELRGRIEAELEAFCREPPMSDFLLTDLEVFLAGGTPLPVRLRDDLTVTVPGEVSNYGQGIYFNIGLQLRNRSAFFRDLADARWLIDLPADVLLDRDSLKQGHGKDVEPRATGQRVSILVVSQIGPYGTRTVGLHLRSSAYSGDRYLTRLQLGVGMGCPTEWISARFHVELSPLRRMN